MSDLYWLTDEQMGLLLPFFPKSHGRPRVDGHRVLSGIIFINRNGLPWLDAAPGRRSTQDTLQPMEALRCHGHFHPNNGWSDFWKGRVPDHHD